MKKSWFIAFMAGLFLGLAFAIEEISFLAFLGWPMLWIACQKAKRKTHSFCLMFLGIFILFSINIHYFSCYIQYGYLLVFISSCILSFFYAPLGIAIWYTGEKNLSWLCPMIWILFEGIGYLLFPFPYIRVAYIVAHWPMAQLAEYIGILGLGMLVLYMAYFFMSFCMSLSHRKTKQAFIYASLVVIAGILTNGIGIIRKEDIQNRLKTSAKVLLVQGLSPYSLNFCPEGEIKKFHAYLQLVQEWQNKNDSKTFDLLIFPENTLSGISLLEKPCFFVFKDTEIFIPNLELYIDYLKEMRIKSPIIIGGSTSKRHDSTEEYNSACFLKIDSEKEISETRTFYHKRTLIPMAEYMPDVLFCKEIAKKMMGFAPYLSYCPQKENTLYFTCKNWKIAPLICWEAAFSEMYITRNPDFFVNITNEAWVSSSWIARQHARIARKFVAIQTRKSLVHCGNAGGTCIIDPTGDTQQFLSYNEPGILFAEVPMVQ